MQELEIMKPTVSNSDISLRELLGVMSRQKWLIMLITALCLGAALAVAFITPREYRSFIRLQVTGRSPAFPMGGGGPDPLTIVSGGSPIAEDIPTQIEVLQSDEVLREACEAQRIQLVISDPTSPPDPHIQVRDVGFTAVLEASVESKTKEYAKQVASQLPVTYRNFLDEKTRQQLRSAIDFLDVIVKKQQDEVDVINNKLKDYRQANKLTGSESDAADRSNRVSRALSGLSDAQAQVASFEQNLMVQQSERTHVPEYTDSNENSTPVEQQTRLMSAVSDLKSERDKLMVRYTEDADPVKEVDEKIKGLEKEIKELPTIMNNSRQIRNQQALQLDASIIQTKASLAGARANLSARQAELSQTQNDLSQYNGAQSEHLQLIRQLSDAGSILQTRIKAREEFVIRVNSIKSPVTVVSAASEPVPFKPNFFLFSIAGLILGMLISIPVVRLKERREDKVRNLGEASEIAGVLPLGHIPALAGRGTAGMTKIDPSTPRFDNFRVLRSNLLVQMADQDVKSILVTSTGRKEGKTDLAYNLAVAMAIDSKKVLLVDANLRQPSLHSRLGLNESPGLTDILNMTRPINPNGEWAKQIDAKISECIHPSEVDNLHIITAGAIVQAPVETLSVPTMQELHDALRTKYDLIIFDSAAFNTPADPQALAKIVDGVLFVVNIGNTKRAPMKYAMDLLRQAKARTLGVVFSNLGATGTALPEHYKHAV